MKEKIIETIKQKSLLEGCKGLVLCVSGGSDSMCLLHFFNENKGIFGVPFVVAHVNHGLRVESVEEEAMLEKYCKERNIPIEILHAKISETKPKGLSTEEYARNVRYEFFDDVRKKYGYTHIATAHNADDNCETFLLNLIRGCGIGGLKGIPVKREDGIIRPLIKCTKKEIYSYCEENGIEFATDKTNFENIYTRNIIRNEIIPLIEKINPSFGDSVLRLASSAEADDEYLESVVDSCLEEIAQNTQKNELPLSYLQELPQSILFRLIRRYFFVNSPKIVLTNKQTNGIIYLVKNQVTSKKIVIENIEIRREYDSLKIAQVGAPTSTITPAELVLGENSLGEIGKIILSEVLVTKDNRKNCLKQSFSLCVRSRQEGDAIKLPGRPEKTLKKLFIDDKIQQRHRAAIPVVTAEDKVVWVCGYGSDENFIPKIGEKAIYLEFKP